MCQFSPVSDVYAVTIIGAGEGINTHFLPEGATDMSPQVRSSIRSIDDLVRQNISSDMSLSSQKYLMKQHDNRTAVGTIVVEEKFGKTAFKAPPSN